MVQLKEIKQIDNGARFCNADLHIHSFGGSHDVTDTTMTPEAIVDSAIKQDLRIISITDHNSNLNVRKAITYAQDKYDGRILVLPGVEITTAHGHLLAYFAPDSCANLDKFLSRIDLIGDMGAENTRTTKSMADTISEAERLGGICIAAHIDRERTGFDKFSAGFQNWKKDIITSPGLYGLECETIEALQWYTPQDEGGVYGAERAKMLSARQNAVSSRPELAHLQGSDAHSLNQFIADSSSKQWTRIKLAELSFSSFCIALKDPMARVRPRATVPHSIPRILGISITGGFLHQEIIHFSDNLNSFIGGRGTGKSTAIRSVAYALGHNDEFEDYDNCPESVTVYCEDAEGIPYRYIRTRGGVIEVKAKEDRSISDVPVDTFRIEYFGQGELAKVAEDPLRHPKIFQDFLDRHTSLRDLLEIESSLVANLRENASLLNQLENLFSQLPSKKQVLADIEKKLKVAEEGKLREIVATQSQLASEKAIRESVEKIAATYNAGFQLTNIQRDFNQVLSTSGMCTDDEESKRIIEQLKSIIKRNNEDIKQKEAELNAILKTCSIALATLASAMKSSHQRMSTNIAIKLADLKSSGLATDIPGLEALLRQKIAIAKEIAEIEQRTNEIQQCRDRRKELLGMLIEVRQEMTSRRKDQLKAINTNLAATIKDYKIFVKYDGSGITDDFESFLKQKMQGTHLQDTLIASFCSKITPSELADLILERKIDEISERAEISKEWAGKLFDKLYYWNILFELQILAKQPKPVITVLTKAAVPKEIQVHQLSDGQRHTILLTIAMLAESNVPLIIDQPEDDLDNAFIFTSIVTTLRAIKEKRQVILVTHNANIAVLGDSELILPMMRENEIGKVKDRGSIDTEATKRQVLGILEGGDAAFQRRKEMYNY